MRINEKLFLLVLCLAILFVTSCDMFTNSMFKGAARDLSKIMEKASTDNLISSGSDPNVIGNPESAKAALEELSKRTDQLENIPVEQAENVLNLANSAILPTSKVMDVVDQILNNESGESTDFVTTLLETLQDIPKIDTKAVETILSKPVEGENEVLNNGDLTTVALATVSLAASALANEEFTPEDYNTAVSKITEKINAGENLNADEILEEINIQNEDNKSAMKTAIEALCTIMDREDFKNLIPSNGDSNSDGSSNE